MKIEHKVSKELVDRMIEIHFPFSWNPYEVTVMEMLDVMPYKIDKWEISYYLTIFWKNGAWYQPDNFHAFTQPLIDIRKEPPNALAEMCIFLYDNWYIKW